MTNGIKATEQKIVVEGKVFFTDDRRRIDLKKPIRDLIGSTMSPVSYKMLVCMSPTSITENMQILLKSGIMPVLLYFEREAPDEMRQN